MGTDRVHVSDNILATCLLDELRNIRTPPSRVRMLVQQLTYLLILEASRELVTRRVRITTPVSETEGLEVATVPVGVPVLRAGLGMLPTFLEVFPHAQVGILGVHREEATLQPISYYQRLPRHLRDKPVFVLDPMLATGGTACACLDILKERGANRVSFLSLVGSPEGVEKLRACNDEVRIFLISLDEGLDDRGYIVPGLGDAGDRLFPVDGWPNGI